MTKAQAGDIIKITNAREGADYNNGDTFEVDLRFSSMGACDDDSLMTTTEEIVGDEEYEIIKYHESRYLSTGEMIDRIQDGSIANRFFTPEGDCSDRFSRAKIDEYGYLRFYNHDDEDWEADRLTPSLLESRWMIEEEEKK